MKTLSKLGPHELLQGLIQFKCIQLTYPQHSVGTLCTLFSGSHIFSDAVFPWILWSLQHSAAYQKVVENSAAHLLQEAFASYLPRAAGSAEHTGAAQTFLKHSLASWAFPSRIWVALASGIRGLPERRKTRKWLKTKFSIILDIKNCIRDQKIT